MKYKKNFIFLILLLSLLLNFKIFKIILLLYYVLYYYKEIIIINKSFLRDLEFDNKFFQ